MNNTILKLQETLAILENYVDNGYTPKSHDIQALNTLKTWLGDIIEAFETLKTMK